MASRRVGQDFTVQHHRNPRIAGYFDRWQSDCIQSTVRDERLWAVCAPTGSGKGVIAKAGAALHRGKNIICTPQTVILKGLEREIDLRLRGTNERIQWRPDLVLRNVQNTTDRLFDFLRSPSNGQSQTAVCCSATLTGLFEFLQSCDQLHLLRNVGVFIDEIHYSDDEDQNKLARVIAYLVDRTSRAPVGVNSATWDRTNLHNLLHRRNEFHEYRYPFHQYLASMTHLRNIRMGFILGTPEQALESFLLENLQRTIVWLPQTGTRYASCPKDEQVERLLRVCGPSDGGHPFRRHRRLINGRTVELTSSDLVLEEGRDSVSGRKSQHMDRLEQDPPDVTLAMRLCLVGYDDPSLQRGLMIGSRGSQIERLQALGRLLRDFQGKETVDFFTVLPPTVDPRQMREYMIEIVASLADIGWRIRPSNINYDLRPEQDDEPVPSDDDREDINIEPIVRTALTAAINNPRVNNIPEIVRAALGNVGDVDALTNELIERITRTVHAISGSDLPLELNLHETMQHGLERLHITLNAQSLIETRAALGCDLGLTLRQVQNAIERHHEETGTWPNERSGIVVGLNGVTWLQVAINVSQRLQRNLDGIVDYVREISRSRRHQRTSASPRAS